MLDCLLQPNLSTHFRVNFLPRKNYPAYMSNFSLCIGSLVELITPRHCCVGT